MQRIPAGLLAALLFALCAPSARADGDPASDLLPLNDVFYSNVAPVSSTPRRALDDEVTAARRAGFEVKVALIASPVDLGAVPELFGHPQNYARFLYQEIRPFFAHRQALLIVMPSGYGAQGLTPRAIAALHSLPTPAGSRGDELARAAAVAVPRLAAAEGHAIKAVATTPSGTGTGLIVARVAAAVATMVLAAVLALRRWPPHRRRRDHPPDRV